MHVLTTPNYPPGYVAIDNPGDIAVLDLEHCSIKDPVTLVIMKDWRPRAQYCTQLEYGWTARLSQPRGPGNERTPTYFEIYAERDDFDRTQACWTLTGLTIQQAIHEIQEMAPIVKDWFDQREGVNAAQSLEDLLTLIKENHPSTRLPSGGRRVRWPKFGGPVIPHPWVISWDEERALVCNFDYADIVTRGDVEDMWQEWKRGEPSRCPKD